MHPCISIIIPVFQVEKYLDRCMESVVNQTKKDIEIILVDDGSTDLSPKKCDIWRGRDSRIKVIHKKNGGLSSARNAGMQVASGDWIGFVDSDDWIALDMYQKLYDLAVETESDITACGVAMVYEDGRESVQMTSSNHCSLSNEEAMKAIIDEKLLKQPVWNRLYKHQIIKDIPFEEGRYHEDVFWSYKAIASAARVSLIGDIGYYYWQRDDSIMGSGYSIHRLDSVVALGQRQLFLEKHYPQLVSDGKKHLWFSCLYHGQQALASMKSEEYRYVLFKLKKILADYPLTLADYRFMKMKHIIWLAAASVNFHLTCGIRNILKIGL